MRAIIQIIKKAVCGDHRARGCIFYLPCSVHFFLMQVPDTSATVCGKCEGVICSDHKCKGNICRTCNNKRSLLSQMFGSWPPPVFEELPKPAQLAFWQADAKSKPALQNALVVQITSERAHNEIDRVAGKYLPLSVYASQGFNTDQIEKNCTHKHDAQLDEEVYKLDMHEVCYEKIKTDVVTQVQNMRNTSLKGRLSHYASPPAKLKRRSHKRSRSSSSKSSSNSAKSSKTSKTSSKSSKPSPKKTKAELKAAAQATKAAAKAAASKVRAEAKAAALAAQKKKAEENKIRKVESVQDKVLQKKARLHYSARRTPHACTRGCGLNCKSKR